jgi:hypothetical protein
VLGECALELLQHPRVLGCEDDAAVAFVSIANSALGRWANLSSSKGLRIGTIRGRSTPSTLRQLGLLDLRKLSAATVIRELDQGHGLVVKGAVDVLEDGNLRTWNSQSCPPDSSCR